MIRADDVVPADRQSGRLAVMNPARSPRMSIEPGGCMTARIMQEVPFDQNVSASADFNRRLIVDVFSVDVLQLPASLFLVFAGGKIQCFARGSVIAEVAVDDPEVFAVLQMKNMMSPSAYRQSVENYVFDVLCKDCLLVFEIRLQHGAGSGCVTDVSVRGSRFGELEITFEVFIVQDDCPRNGDL